jgi:PIN domain nuclease of toxin-antitoxin system
MAVVLDTHAAIWYLTASNNLSSDALRAIQDSMTAADPVYLPSICIVEVIFLVEKKRIPAEALERLLAALADADSALRIAPLDLNVAMALARVPREALPDMPDRIIAATALHLDVPVVTRDQRMRASSIKTVW